MTAYSRIRVCVTDQHDWRVKLLACQDANLAGHYFEHCSSTSKKYSHTLITTAMQLHVTINFYTSLPILPLNDKRNRTKNNEKRPGRLNTEWLNRKTCLFTQAIIFSITPDSLLLPSNSHYCSLACKNQKVTYQFLE